MKDGKITVDDFKNDSTIEQMRSALGSINSKDLAGYTPLCFAVLNGIAPEIIVALVNDHSASTSIASKGKSPMQTACQAMNVNAVKALIGEEIEYIVIDDNGNPKQAYIDCLPAYVKDEDGNDTEEPLPLKNKVCIVQSKRYRITDADILSASILSKEDILKAILEYKNTRISLTNIKDKSKNNPLHLACIAQCYGSVDLLYIYRSNNDDFKNAANSDACQNDDEKTPMDIAEDSGDGTLVAKLKEYCGIPLNDIISGAFAKKQNDVVNDILINKVSSVYIYDYYTNVYSWGSSPDYTPVTQKTVAKYINEENNEDLYELLLSQYNNNNYTYFENNRYYNILAYLCYKKKSPLTTFNDIFVEFTNSSDYTAIVKSMFINDWVDIDKICDITDNSTRNNCVNVIFTGDFNSESFIKLIECNSEHRSTIVSSLYQSGYFTFNDIISLIGYTQDNYLYRLIYDLDTLVVLDQIFSISNEFEDFKTGLIAYLYSKRKITLSDIESRISDSDYKASVVVYLFTSQHILLSDVLTSTSLSSTTKQNVVNKLCENDITILDEIFSDAFENNLTSIIDYTLKNIVKSDTIYEWYNKSYHLNGQLKSIAKYCNDKQDTEGDNLRNLFIDNFDSSKHLKTLVNLQCSKIIALLRINDKLTLNEICSVQDDNTQQVIDDLYEDEEFNLQDLLDSELPKDKIFDIISSMMADDQVNIDKINSEITDDEFRAELLEYLHDKGAFNSAPIAVLSEDYITVLPGDIIELDASSSSDPNSDPISFLWSGEYSYLLDDITSSKPKFTAPADLLSSTNYTFTVTVSDSFGLSDSASATVSVYVAENHAPAVVLAQSSFVTTPGSTIILDASESSDPDGDDISFTWSGEYVYLLDDVSVGKKQFTIPSNLQSTFTYTFTVTVTDTHGASDSKNITVTANVQPNQAPIVVIDDVFEGQPGDIVELDASYSYDPDNDPISYTWEGTYASQLVCTNPAKPKFTIPLNAVIGSEYRFTARVTDSRGASSSKLVTVRVPSVIGTLLFTTGTFAAETEIPEAAEQLYNNYRERGFEIKENFNLIYDEDAIVTE